HRHRNRHSHIAPAASRPRALATCFCVFGVVTLVRPAASFARGGSLVGHLLSINYNARLYDPQIARFMSADSIIPDPTNGQSFNRYAYVSNNPLNAVDPSGYAGSCTTTEKTGCPPT